MSPTIKQLPVDLDELCIALTAEADVSGLTWFLDLESGRVILVNREYDPAEWDGLQLGEIEASPARFKRVPPADHLDLLNDMTAFVAALTDARLKESLELALSAPRPERRFRAVLGWLPDELERWQGFRHAATETRAHHWLTSLGVAVRA